MKRRESLLIHEFSAIAFLIWSELFLVNAVAVDESLRV